jgi:hypothetical protein
MTEDVIPAKPTPFKHRMGHLAACAAGGRAIKIVAIGSSTTVGEGGIVSYPQRLEFALRAHYPGRHVDVLNRGVGGEEAPAEADRMQRDVIVENPCAVIWRVGINGVWQKQDLQNGCRRYPGWADTAGEGSARYCPDGSSIHPRGVGERAGWWGIRHGAVH